MTCPPLIIYVSFLSDVNSAPNVTFSGNYLLSFLCSCSISLVSNEGLPGIVVSEQSRIRDTRAGEKTPARSGSGFPTPKVKSNLSFLIQSYAYQFSFLVAHPTAG
jgi:hypothetical protein